MSANTGVSTGPFVIITPAHNEAALIERTVVSMIAQEVRPLRWVVVDDASTDGTADIVRRYAAKHPFMTLLELRRTGSRHFGNKVRAFNAGLAELGALDFCFLGNLDADISLQSDYYRRVLAAFAMDPRLGIAGGMVASRIGTRFVRQEVAPDSVAGAVQLFRRDCFEQIGGYLAVPEGGIDSAAEIMARMQGWKVRTFAEIEVLEHRRTGTASALPVAAKLKEGRRLHSLGYGFLFLCLRCVYRVTDPPWLIGSAATLAGYLQRSIQRAPAVLPADVVGFLRHEQRNKLKDTLRNACVRHRRHL